MLIEEIIDKLSSLERQLNDTLFRVSMLKSLEARDRERELILRIESLEVENEYLQEYIHYLIGGYTKEEFKLIAAKYAKPLDLEEK